MTETRQAFMEAQARMLERYGVAAESRLVDVKSIGGQAQVLVSGSGPAVLLISGIGTPAAMWAPLLAELTGFQLHAVDLPGYGLTDGPPGFIEHFRETSVRFLEEVLDGLALERAAMIGNSLGSLLSSWLAIDSPSRVAALVHVGCPALVLDSSPPLPMRLLSVGPLGRLLTRLDPPSKNQVDRLSKMVNEYPLEPELVDLLVATEEGETFRPMFLGTLNKLIRLRGSRPTFRLTGAQLSRIAQPTLLIWGKDDPFGEPEVGVRMAASMPKAELQVIEGGHAPWLRQATVIGPSIARFLRQAS